MLIVQTYYKHIDYYGTCNNEVNIVDSDLSSFLSFLREKFPNGEIHSNFYVIELNGGEMFIFNIKEAEPVSPDKFKFEDLTNLEEYAII